MGKPMKKAKNSVRTTARHRPSAWAVFFCSVLYALYFIPDPRHSVLVFFARVFIIPALALPVVLRAVAWVADTYQHSTILLLNLLFAFHCFLPSLLHRWSTNDETKLVYGIGPALRAVYYVAAYPWLKQRLLAAVTGVLEEVGTDASAAHWRKEVIETVVSVTKSARALLKHDVLLPLAFYCLFEDKAVPFLQYLSDDAVTRLLGFLALKRFW